MLSVSPRTFRAASPFARENSLIAFILAVILFAPHPASATLTNGENAIDGLGQFDIDNATVLYTKGGVNNGPNELGVNTPYATALDSTNHRLFVADYTNNRVLVYTLTNSNLLSSHTPANVLGQPSFTSNGSATTQSGMYQP